MAVVIERVELGKNPVQTGETLIISVTIVTHGHLRKSTYASLTEWTNGQLRLRGESVSTHAKLTICQHSVLQNKTHRQIETMETMEVSHEQPRRTTPSGKTESSSGYKRS